MQEQESSEISSEYTAYDLKAQAISEIPDLNQIPNHNIETIRILHSPSLKSMKGIEIFTKLQEINLSSNSIERIESLEKLKDLKVLDLSCNKIRVISGLANLFKLEKLVLSHNKITNIQNLKQISGEKCSLTYLDLSDNKISDYKELLILNSFGKLEILFFSQGKNSNPICKRSNYYIEVLQSLKNFQKFQVIDGVKPEKLAEQIDQKPEKLKEKENFIENEISPIKQKEFMNSPLEMTKTKAKLKNFPVLSENYEEEPIKFTENELKNKESEYKGEICNLKYRLEDMISSQKDLIYKYEMSEKFWGTKCEKMEKDFFEISTQNKTQKKEIKRLLTENINVKNELELIKKENKENVIKKERKDEIVENLHQRVSLLLKENGEFHKESVLKSEEIDRLNRELKSSESLIKELKISLRENERILSDFHSKSLENASFSLQRGEEMKRKFESIYEENKVLISENSELKQKNSNLLDLTKEWEYKFDGKFNEIKYEFEKEIKKMMDSYEKKIFELSHSLNYSKKEQDNEFKKNLDLLEEEFKKVLNENNEKFRQLKQAFDEKNKNENDLKNLLKAALMKNNEQEGIIGDFEMSLQKIKKDVGEIVTERDLLLREANGKKNTKDKELDLVTDEKARLESEKAFIEVNFAKLKDLRNQELLELNNLRNKLMVFENVENEIEDLRSHIETKTRILEDKNETIANLKEENENLKQNFTNLSDDFTKISKKFEKQTEIIEELEQQSSNFNEENKFLKKELKEKKALIKMFENEIENIRHLQENELSNLKENSKKKEEKINELLKTLEDCKGNLMQNQEKFKEKEKIINEMEVQFLYKEGELKNRIKGKEREVEEFRGKLEENEEEMKILITEIEKQKRMAKENIEKLNKIFNI